MLHLIKRKWIGGVLLVAGTTIGGGMLALPVSTGLSGFFPSLLLLFSYWLFMAYTAFLFLEVNLSIEGHPNLISMANKTLGRWGEVFSWVAYLFLLYTLTTAYIAGSSAIFLDGFQALFHTRPSFWVGPLPLLILFGSLVYLGTEFVDGINRFLMLGLVVSYALLIAVLAPDVSLEKITHVDFSYILFGLSIVSVSFGYHIIIPTLTQYLDRDPYELKKVIWIGSLIPLLFYLVWQFVSLGVVPQEGACSLKQGYKQGNDVVQLIIGCMQHPQFKLVARFLSFFAIITSFLGVSLSLSDFLSDGLNVEKKGAGSFFLYFLTFGPPLFFTWIDARAFLNALEYGGAFGVVLLLAILPILMVISNRYVLKAKSPIKAFGGKTMLGFGLLLSLFVMAVEIAHQLSYLSF